MALASIGMDRMFLCILHAEQHANPTQALYYIDALDSQEYHDDNR